MTNFPIKTFNGAIQNQPTQLINARELHQFLQIDTRFNDWIKRRIADYDFVPNLDFIGVIKIEHTEAGFFGKRETKIKDYHLTLDMAKELCMLERSELGRQARRYFIEKERQALALSQQMQAQLRQIPPFLRQNPDELAKLIEQAQQALFTAMPECKDIQRYRQMGLTNAEIGKLLNLGETALKNRIHKMLSLAIITSNAPAHKQLALL